MDFYLSLKDSSCLVRIAVSVMGEDLSAVTVKRPKNVYEWESSWRATPTHTVNTNVKHCKLSRDLRVSKTDTNVISTEQTQRQPDEDAERLHKLGCQRTSAQRCLPSLGYFEWPQLPRTKTTVYPEDKSDLKKSGYYCNCDVQHWGCVLFWLGKSNQRR